MCVCVVEVLSHFIYNFLQSESNIENNLTQSLILINSYPRIPFSKKNRGRFVCVCNNQLISERVAGSPAALGSRRRQAGSANIRRVLKRQPPNRIGRNQDLASEANLNNVSFMPWVIKVRDDGDKERGQVGTN